MRTSFAETYLPTVSVGTIYNKLADEESREIFNWRYQYFKTRDYKELIRKFLNDGENSINRWYLKETNDVEFLRTLNFLAGEEAKKKGVILYGAGVALTAIIRFVEYFGVEIKAICDTHKFDIEHRGRSIITVEKAVSANRDTAVLITTLHASFKREMKKTLENYGLIDEMIYKLGNDTFSADAMYFRKNIIGHVADEVFIDAGCYNGDTITAFCNFTHGEYKYIYGFEPNAPLYEKTCDYLLDKQIKNVAMHCKGLWDAHEILEFMNADMSGGSRIVNSKCIFISVLATSYELTRIETTTLDDTVDKKDAVTLIKMDIEGAELNALHGAREIIKRDKPRLIICLYHKPTDIIEIPAYILSLRPDYNLYIRHNLLVYENDTVIYAV
jgi:FkbM family methyltransferase